MANLREPSGPQCRLLCLVVAGLLSGNSSFAQNTASPPTPEGAVTATHPFPRRVPAPAIDSDFAWINTTRPITLADLRGKFVLVDFWTFCCINCMHVLPELKKLERAYPNEVVVVGVHSAKFEGDE